MFNCYPELSWSVFFTWSERRTKAFGMKAIQFWRTISRPERMVKGDEAWDRGEGFHVGIIYRSRGFIRGTGELTRKAAAICGGGSPNRLLPNSAAKCRAPCPILQRGGVVANRTRAGGALVSLNFRIFQRNSQRIRANAASVDQNLCQV